MLADLYLCASTIDGASFQQRLKAASAGYMPASDCAPATTRRRGPQGKARPTSGGCSEIMGLKLTEIGFLPAGGNPASWRRDRAPTRTSFTG